MLRRDAGKSVSICDGFRNRDSFHMGRGFLPFLAVMLLATPQLAFAQDSLAVTVNPRSLDIEEDGENNRDKYRVQLDADPSEEVVITVDGGTGVVTVDPSSITLTPDTLTPGDALTPGNWKEGLEFTVTAVGDANAVDETVTLTHTATIGGDEEEVTLRNVSVTVRVKDLDTRAVTIDATDPLVVIEAASATYTIVLETQPTATVTVDIGGASGELAVSPSRLFFTPDNYEMPQTVNVYAGEDFDAEDDSATLTHTIRGGDYTGVSATPGTVSVMVDDNDMQGVTVSTGTLNIATGATATYTVMLNTQPTRTVSISVAEDTDNVGVRVSPSRLSFSTSSWNRPQTVTVRADSDATGSVTVQHAVEITSSSRDKGYDELNVADVVVTVSGAQPGIRLSPSSLNVDEGASRTYTVRLASAPTGGDEQVTVEAPSGSDLTLSGDTLSGDTLSGNSLTFTEDDWNTAQTVTVTAAEDEDAVQDTVMVTHTFNDAITTNSTLRVTIRENDTRGVTVTPPSLEINEGASGTYTVALDSEPTGNVTVTINGASGDVTLDRSQLTFSTGNWFSAQEVVVSAADDPDGEPDDSVTLTHTVRGADYDRMRADSVRITVREDETRDITVTTMDTTSDDGALVIAEGATGKYTVALESQPTGTVTVMVRGQSGDVTVKPSRLIFTTSNWNDPQTVEVKAGEDNDAELDPVVTLTHAASGGGYNGVVAGEVTVTITENDTKGVRVTPRALTVNEGGASSSYTVALTTEPTGTVTVTLGGLAYAREHSLMVNPTSLTFTARNWNIPQRVTVSASEDDDGSSAYKDAESSKRDVITLTHTVRGGGYDSTGDLPEVTVLPVTVTVRDNDMVGVTVTPRQLEIVQNSSRTYTVVLNTKPTGNVQVSVTGEPGGVTVSPSPLTFTPANWSSPRTVRVHVDDTATPTTTGETTGKLRNEITSTGVDADTDYDDLEAVPVELTIKDSDVEDVAVNPTELTVTEGGNASYTLVLTKRPTATVTVEISGAAGDVRLSRTRLSFSTSNWNRDQTVTVRLSEDDDAIQDAAVTLTHEVTGADEYEVPPIAFSVSVILKENDTRGVAVSPTSLTVPAGGSGTYSVSLNTEPADAVTVVVNSPSDDVTVTGSPLIFTPQNWSSGQTVRVMVAADAGGKEAMSVTLTHTVTGGDYLGVEPASVTVTIPVEGAPSAPTGLTAESGDRSVTLTWGAPADDGGSAIVRYQVRYQEIGGSYSAWTTVSGGAGATSTTVSGLVNGTSYEFQVRAVNGISPGQAATASATLAESAPGAPAGLTAAGGDESVALSWSAPGDGGSQILRYEYRYAASGETYGDWATVSGGGSARSVTITGLTNGTLYGFQVRAVNNIGEGEASQATATPGRAPSAPMGLTARVESETITVMWGMPADNGGSAITGYQARYRMNGGQWTNWMMVEGGANATSYTMTGLSNGIGHEVEVRAVNAIGPGASASVEATPMEALVFAHFANGKSGEMTNISDLVLVNVETSAVNVAIYFYGKDGVRIAADSLVDMTGDMEDTGDGGVTVDIVGQGEMTVSTNGEGEFETGSVKVFSTGRIGGVLRYDISMIGVAGVGASAPVSDAIFPVRRMEGGINTGVAIRNLESEPTDVTCHLMKGGGRLSGPGVTGELPAGGQVALFIDQMFGTAGTSDFSGSVRCMAAEGGMFTAVVLEMDDANQIFTTLPVVPVDEAAADDGMSTLNFAHFANGEFGGMPISSDLVFVNVANTAVAPVIYFYDRDGNMIDADMVVDTMMEGVDFADDGALTVMDQIPPLGEMTISTTGMGDDVVGSVRVVSDGPIGGVLRFVTSNIGVAGVGASEAVNAAIFPARYMENGINTGAAIRNLESEKMTVTCKLMQGGQMEAEKPIILEGNAQNSQFITEVFKDAFMAPGMTDFEGSVHCTAPEGGMFTGIALEMDFINRVFTTLPVVPVQ